MFKERAFVKNKVKILVEKYADGVTEEQIKNKEVEPYEIVEMEDENLSLEVIKDAVN